MEKVYEVEFMQYTNSVKDTVSDDGEFTNTRQEGSFSAYALILSDFLSSVYRADEWPAPPLNTNS